MSEQMRKYGYLDKPPCGALLPCTLRHTTHWSDIAIALTENSNHIPYQRYAYKGAADFIPRGVCHSVPTWYPLPGSKCAAYFVCTLHCAVPIPTINPQIIYIGFLMLGFIIISIA